MNEEIEKQIREIMETKDGFISNNNYKLIEIKDNYCKLEGTITEDSLNPYGIVHGGYIFGLADTAGGIVVSTSGRAGVTTSSTILYLRKGTGNKLTAIAKCLKSGKSIMNCEVEIFDEQDKLVSKVLLEYMFL